MIFAPRIRNININDKFVLKNKPIREIITRKMALNQESSSGGEDALGGGYRLDLNELEEAALGVDGRREEEIPWRNP